MSTMKSLYYTFLFVFCLASCSADNDLSGAGDDPDDNFSYEFIKRSFTHELTQKNIPYGFFKPKPSLGTTDEKFPLILALHGAEYMATEEKLFLSLESINAYATGWIKKEKQDDYPAYVLAPNIHSELATVEAGYRFPYTGDNGIDLIEKLLDHIIAENPNIDTGRIYLTGHSTGGVGTWFLGARMKDRFAAIVPLSSAFSTKGETYAYVNSQVDAGVFQQLPVWSFIHRRDANLNQVTSGDGDHGCRGIFSELLKNDFDPVFTHAFLGTDYYLTQAQIKEAVNTDKKHFYTEYEYACSLAECHFAMNTALEEPLLFEWLFKQRKQ